MPWCPNCHAEYREGFKKCNDCEVELVDEPNIEEEESIELDTEAFLTSVSDNINADMIEAKLNDNGIPVLKKYKESGGYLNIYMGATSYGVELYVPSRLLEKAKELLSTEGAIEENEPFELKEDTEDAEMKDTERIYQKKRQFRAWIILLVFTPGLIWMIYALIMILLEKFILK
ncbi:MAG: DUF2007 domain-containing protein [Clostridia bacterium]|nr:DUF2007 domain-containing protein [Clostridia bacterium]